MSIGLGLIGYGGMGSWHAEMIREKLKDITVAGIWDIREEARAKAKANGFNVYSSLDELLGDDKVQLVTIATPNDWHKPLAKAAFAAGKNVVSEKPVSLCAADLQEMIDASRAAGKLFSVHQNRRWDRDFKMVRSILENGTIGKPYFIESRVLGSRRVLFGWRGVKKEGGGMLLDWGVHLIDQLMDMIDEKVVSVGASLQEVYADEADDNCKVILTFESGLQALVEVATNCLIMLPRWHIEAKDGTAVIEDWDCNGKIVQIREGSEMEWSDRITYTSAGPTRTMSPRPVQTTIELPLPEVKADWSEFYQNIADTIAGKAELIVRPEQAMRVMKVIDLCFESSEKRCALPCSI